MQKINYQVMTGDVDGYTWINNQRVRVGQTVRLSPLEAKYLEMSGQVEKVRDLGAQKAKATAKAKAAVEHAGTPAEASKE